jgi:hypothetical protein
MQHHQALIMWSGNNYTIRHNLILDLNFLFGFLLLPRKLCLFSYTQFQYRDLRGLFLINSSRKPRAKQEMVLW